MSKIFVPVLSNTFTVKENTSGKCTGCHFHSSLVCTKGPEATKYLGVCKKDKIFKIKK